MQEELEIMRPQLEDAAQETVITMQKIEVSDVHIIFYFVSENFCVFIPKVISLSTLHYYVSETIRLISSRKIRWWQRPLEPQCRQRRPKPRRRHEKLRKLQMMPKRTWMKPFLLWTLLSLA